MKPKGKHIDFEQLESEFITPDPVNDGERTFKLKEVIRSLDETSKRLILIYLDQGSYRKASSLLGVSPSLYCNQIKSIREKIDFILNGNDN